MVNRVKKWILAVAIMIVFNLFINYGIETFYKGPEYGDYCTESPRSYAMPLKEAMNCSVVSVSNETETQCKDKGYISFKYDSNGCATEAYCETCQAEFDATSKAHDGNVFVALLIVAVIALGIGIMVKAEAVSVGLLLGGILDLIIASIRYWAHLQSVYRFVLLGVVLAVLLWLGYKKVK